jgi:hypothetical protein
MIPPALPHCIKRGWCDLIERDPTSRDGGRTIVLCGLKTLVCLRAMSFPARNLASFIEPNAKFDALQKLIAACSRQAGSFGVLSVTGHPCIPLRHGTGCFCGYIAGAWLSDLIGRRKTFIIAAVCRYSTKVNLTCAANNNTTRSRHDGQDCN